MSQDELEKSWASVSARERAAIGTELAAIAARFHDQKKRSVSECYDHCADMQQAVQEHCQQLGGEAAAYACALHAEHAAKACYDVCPDTAGVPHD